MLKNSKDILKYLWVKWDLLQNNMGKREELSGQGRVSHGLMALEAEEQADGAPYTIMATGAYLLNSL